MIQEVLQMIIEKTENGIYKMLDLSGLPKGEKQGKNSIDWRKCKNESVPFSYDGFVGVLNVNFMPEFENYGGSNLFVEVSYKENRKIMRGSKLRSFQFFNLIRKEVAENKVRLEAKAQVGKKKFGLEIIDFKINLENPNRRIEYEIADKEIESSYWLTEKSWKNLVEKPRFLAHYPEIVKVLQNPEDKMLQHKSNSSVNLECPVCGFSMEKKVCELTRRGFNCPTCGDRTSYPERYFKSILRYLKIDFLSEHCFTSDRNLRFDFYIPHLNICIETHGVQHFSNSSSLFDYERTKKSDEKKREFCLANNIRLIEVDCSRSEVDYIRNSIKKNEQLDFLKVSEQAFQHAEDFIKTNTSPLKKRVVDLYYQGKSYSEIYEETGVVRSSASSFLKQFGIDTGETMKKRKMQSPKGRRMMRPVVCINTKKVFPSITRTSGVGGLKGCTSVVKALTNVQKTAGKHPVTGERLKWMYYEDYVEKYGTEGLTEYVEEEVHI